MYTVSLSGLCVCVVGGARLTIGGFVWELVAIRLMSMVELMKRCGGTTSCVSDVSTGVGCAIVQSILVDFWRGLVASTVDFEGVLPMT